ncbi:MAG: RecX family transcriptional regulator [Clostridiales bacterium]|jgi:SOS response regulatory protein OraA/RecX|nr:RecX family transcriptional regulator [Clostridiales bacterium]
MSAKRLNTEFYPLDDAERAENTVRFWRERGYGRSRIEFEIQKRGIPREYWGGAFERVDGVLHEEAAETEAAASIIDNYDLPRGLTPGIRRRIVSALKRRGHSRDVIIRAFMSRGFEISM